MTPIAELIVQNIVDVIGGITQSAGYETNIVAVEREKVGANVPKNGVAVVVIGIPARRAESPLMHDDFQMPIAVAVWVTQTDSAGPVAQTLYTVAADIRKALGVDLHRDGLAIHTSFQDDEFHGDGAIYRAVVKAEIWFRTLRNNPYR